jgi:hypothetical protein
MNTSAFVLILFAHVGPMGNGNSNAITTAEFTSRERCEAAAVTAKKLASGSTKVIEAVCMPK